MRPKKPNLKPVLVPITRVLPGQPFHLFRNGYIGNTVHHAEKNLEGNFTLSNTDGAASPYVIQFDQLVCTSACFVSDLTLGGLTSKIEIPTEIGFGLEVLVFENIRANIAESYVSLSRVHAGAFIYIAGVSWALVEHVNGNLTVLRNTGHKDVPHSLVDSGTMCFARLIDVKICLDSPPVVESKPKTANVAIFKVRLGATIIYQDTFWRTIKKVNPGWVSAYIISDPKKTAHLIVKTSTCIAKISDIEY